MTQPTIQTLENGARIIHAPNPHLNSVSVVPGIHVGSRHETTEINGLSHFVEHLMFKGTVKYPTAEALSSTIDRVGGFINASTDHEITNIQIQTAKAYESIAADVAMELLTAPLFLDEAIEKERPVVCDEIKMYEADDQSRAWDLYNKLMFPEHPLGWPIAGYAPNIETVSPDTVRAFRARNYVPEQIVVTLAGNYSADVANAVRARLEALPSVSSGRGSLAAPLHPNAAQVEFKESFTPRATLFFGSGGPGKGLDKEMDRTALELLGLIFGGYMSSRLFIEIRERRSLCYSVGATMAQHSDASTLVTWMMLEPEQLTKALPALGVELRRLFADITANELESAKSHILGGLALENDRCLGRAVNLTKDLTVHGHLETDEEKTARYSKVTLDDVQNALRTYVKNIQTVVVAPEEHLGGLREVCVDALRID